MRIKKIEIEGFKSYAQRQVVDQLDTQFNAITGLNGSGKSNILDAICFLLGITNLQQVRAQNLTDLVYKQGQAGINRATVTITFDNTGPNDQRPTGYDKQKEIVVRRQIIINGRNTYQINGVAATNTRVTDLFRMVGINVNNPHFLIMQGRITKVLNMKPVELLSMVEEAAGVRMYECKKQSALKTIEKKEDKVKEISHLMDDDILPRVEKLKRDRANYLEYQQIERELEERERKFHAYDYYESFKQIREKEKDAQKKHQEAQEVRAEIDERQAELQREEETHQEMERVRAEGMSSERSDLDKRLRDLFSEQAKKESEREGKESIQRELKVTIDRKNKSLNNDRKILEKKNAELARLEGDVGDEERRGKAAEDAEILARKKLEALALGMITDDQGNALTLDSKLTNARTSLSDLQTNTKTAELQLHQLKPSLKKKRDELHGLTRKSDSNQSAKDQLEREIAETERRLNGLSFDEAAEQNLGEERKRLVQESQDLSLRVDQFEARFHYLQFKYTDPYPNFDHSKVKGPIAKLIKVRDMDFATALEVVAGGRISNIVVDRAETSKSLLQNGRLEKRVTFIPLDKIDSREIQPAKLAEARRLVGEGNVFLARELVEYDPELDNAMKYVFGNTLMCRTMEQAKILAFNSNVKQRTVTIEGEEYKPQGVLTGGSRSNRPQLLRELHAISGTYVELDARTRRVREIEAELKRLQPVRQQFDQLSNQLNASRRKLEAVNDSMKNSPIQMLTDEIQRLEEEIGQAQETIEANGPKIQALSEEIKQMERQKKDEKTYRETEKKKAQKQLADAQKELAALKDTFSNIKETLSALREEIASLEQSIQEDSDEITTLTNRLEETGADIEAAKASAAEARERVKEAQAELDQYNKELRQHDKAIRVKVAELDSLKKKIRQLEAKIDSLERDAAECAKSSKEFAKRVHHLEKQHKWIPEEKDNFGVEGGLYDFRNYSMDVGRREIEVRRERSKQLQHTINMRAMQCLDTAEEQCRELEKKRHQLELDKQQLYDTIEQLDEKKKRELLAAHEMISRDFGQIYSTLLPGATAELVPSGESDEENLRGLEIRVAFSGKYKDSLTELSGGQRSLVALSLILAMLKFKPAPFYILDEVDAALDLSHTEHIGKVIKNHFKESQFIVVSLKDGFFNNANVLYRTKFVDGTSTVTRLQNA